MENQTGMKIFNCTDYNEMSRLSCDSVVSDLRKQRNLLLCTATGNSPIGLYERLKNDYGSAQEVFGELRVLKLDEWGGISAEDPNSCESFIREYILGPLRVSNNRYISFKSDSLAPEKECERIQQEIQRHGPIDICVLGLGKNGHIGFNEPAQALSPHCHIAELSALSLEHAMTASMKKKPKYGLTLGMADILQSKKIILLLSGSEKRDVISEFLSKKISTKLPASFLWLHPNAECYIDNGTV